MTSFCVYPNCDGGSQTGYCYVACREIDSLRAEVEKWKVHASERNAAAAELWEDVDRLRGALEEIKRLNEMSGFNGCAIAEVYSKHLSDQPKETK